MSTYTSEKILLPSGLDEIALHQSMIRLPKESLVDFKKRLLLEQRDPVNNSFRSFLKSPSRQVGQLDIPIARLSLADVYPSPRLVITSSKLYLYTDVNADPIVELDLQHRDGSYFLTDVMTALTDTGVLSIEYIDTGYAYRFSRNLRIMDTDTQVVEVLGESYVNRLTGTNLRDYRFSNAVSFSTLKGSAAELEESGDFYIDTVNGVVFSYDTQSQSISYTYSNFPCILWWQPVRVFELNDQDIDVLIKDNINVDEGTERRTLNRVGSAYVNELCATHSLEWGK